LIREFVMGTYERLLECADCFQDDDASADLKTQMEPSRWENLKKPLNYLVEAFKKSKHAKLGGHFEKAMEDLETFLKTNHVHFLTAAFRELGFPLKFTFDILSCSLKTFRSRCNTSYMASVGKTAYMAIIGKEVISLSGSSLLTLLNQDGDYPSMIDFECYFQNDMEKVIFF